MDKNEKEGRNDNFHFRGQQFFVNGVLQEDRLKPPTYTELNYSLLHEAHILNTIDLYEMERPLAKDGNEFFTFAVCTNRLEVVRWAYIKVYALHPEAACVPMAYKLPKIQGLCDDDEHKVGYRLLRVLQRKKLRGAAVFVARKFTRAHHQLGAKRFQIFTTEAESMADFVLNSASRNADEAIPAMTISALEALEGHQEVTSSQEST